MICPACGAELQESKVGDAAVWACTEGCGGIWFDHFVLQKVHRSEPAVHDGLCELGTDRDVEVDETQKRTCPRCAEIVMLKHFFGVKQEIQVDECPGCGGLWLDRGKFARIEAQFDSDEAREKAETAYFSKIRKQLDLMHAKRPKAQEEDKKEEKA